MSRDRIGLHIASFRRIRGLSQRQLAARVTEYRIPGRTGRDVKPITREYISMIESGRRAIVKRDLLTAFTLALGVTVTDLTGQPYPPKITGDLDFFTTVPNIRRALDDPEKPITPRPLDALDALCDAAMRARMRCDIDGLGGTLPPVLAEARALYLHTHDPRAGQLLVRGLVTGSLALKPAGWLDLAIRMADLADRYAQELGDPVACAAAAFAVAQCALTDDNRQRSLRVSVGAIDALHTGQLPLSRMADAAAWAGLLHLHAALTCASGHDDDQAQMHLAAADGWATQSTGDPWRMEFCPANVDTWRVGIAVESGNPDEAPTLARHVDVGQLRTPHRRARLHMDTGRAQFMVGDSGGAIRSLLAADNEAPGDLRHRVPVVEIVAHLVHNVPPRGGSVELLELARRVGVDPAARAVED